MRPSAFTSRSRLFAQVAAASLLAAFAAGCSADVERFASNPFSNPFSSSSQEPAQTGSIGGSSYGAAPRGSVSSEPLPPVGQSAAQGQYNQGQAAQGQYGQNQYGQGQYNQGQYAPPPAQSAQQNSWNTPVGAAPSAPYGAQGNRPGYGVPQNAVAASGSAHTVAPGETIYSIARLYGVKATDVASVNGLSLDTKVRVGQQVNLPTGARRGSAAVKPAQADAKLAAATPAVAAPVAPAVNAALPATSKPLAAPAAATAQAQTQAPAAVSKVVARPETAAETVAAPARSASNELAFRWPVQGRVISGFGPKPNGVANEGVNLAVPEGTPVKASESGVVVYSGSELKGYGNLVLVRHANGYVTAYAHASELSVKRGDQVRRGQVIAKSGKSGDVSAPQLHFEVRKGSTPVDPMQYLKAGG